MTRSSPVALRCTSNSTDSTERSSRLRKPVMLFSAQRLRAPRWPTMMGLFIGNTSFLFAGIHQALGEPALHQQDEESGRRHHKKGSGHGDVPGRLGVGDRDQVLQ